ncbi:unnamed protein product [Clonostachys byssicola]|uniref:Aminotransferase class V domain-containing protein n=1 Tax=Clonostachys byssicola TaxID=160290 RepID=A0A9N9TY20_9HYPO|nr:unnamed protein product [Clonostachys byssicola]
MSEAILDFYPEYAATEKLDLLRQSAYGYSYLDEQGHVYLDYGGAGLASRAQIQAHSSHLTGVTLGNPHSVNPTSRTSSELIDRTRAKILSFFNASPEEYAVVFTPNASGAARLVGESYPFRKHSRLVMTADNHNSIHGLRCFAHKSRATHVYVPMTNKDELRTNTKAVEDALPSLKERRLFKRSGPSLFAFPAQSNFSGVCHPLSWAKLAQDRGYDVLLDAAAYLPTKKLDFSVIKPEFTIVSWYKVMGFPTGVGSLIIRKDALARLQRPWFSGGTVKAASVSLPWQLMTTDESSLEDGTLNFWAIPDIHIGLDWLGEVGMDMISLRVQCLTGYLIRKLMSLHHTDGRPMTRLYGPQNTENRGGTVAFNLLDSNGQIFDGRIVAKESAAYGISLRTGCFCNPGVGEAAFGVTKSALEPLKKVKGDLSMDEILEIIGLSSFGAIRVSLGIASTVKDVDLFLTFAEKVYKNRLNDTSGLEPRSGC